MDFSNTDNVNTLLREKVSKVDHDYKTKVVSYSTNTDDAKALLRTKASNADSDWLPKVLNYSNTDDEILSREK